MSSKWLNILHHTIWKLLWVLQYFQCHCHCFFISVKFRHSTWKVPFGYFVTLSVWIIIYGPNERNRWRRRLYMSALKTREYVEDNNLLILLQWSIMKMNFPFQLVWRKMHPSLVHFQSLLIIVFVSLSISLTFFLFGLLISSFFLGLYCLHVFRISFSCFKLIPINFKFVGEY